MRTRRLLLAAACLFSAGFPSAAAAGAARELPAALREWAGWATWDDTLRACPTPYHDPDKPLCLWPSRLAIEADGAEGRFALAARVFAEAWVALPGGGDLWPVELRLGDGTSPPVLEHAGKPAVKLPPGEHELRGKFRWQGVPQRIALPAEIGILTLKLDGREVDSPVWDARGYLWLKRDAAGEQADKDFLGVKLHAVIEDGIPLWLRGELELIVAGKSREEALGAILPAGWKLAAVEGPLPVAVDASGNLKAQVRAGKWTLRFDAFRPDHPAEIAYAPGLKPAVKEQWIAFAAKPEFRLVEVTGIPPVDVTQTSFPEKWRHLPVYQWDTAAAFKLEERLRGMGMQQPAGLRIRRELWLDEDGKELAFRDQLGGSMQQIWRLDAAAGQQLGSVRADGEGQLITRNPRTGASGVEVRKRDVNLEATGRMPRGAAIPASGWRTDAEGVDVTLQLPPGWRLLALFGADRVSGDWLTAWSLLDMFLLLLFTLAVFRLWGWKAGLLAFFAFGLAYHERDAPRYVWFWLLIPLALQRVVTEGWGRRLVLAWKWLGVLALVLVLVPFVAKQIQHGMYPQLEMTGGGHRMPAPASASIVNYTAASESGSTRGDLAKKLRPSQNLQYDSKAVIQVGEGVPQWSWRGVSYGWNGPVKEDQQVRPVLIPPGMQRILTIVRVALLLALAAWLLDARKLGRLVRPGAAAMIAAWCGLLWLAGAPAARAEFPDKELLETLRQRLNEKPDAYPNAADIPQARLVLDGRKLRVEAEIHAAIETAVPLPGRLPAWSPLAVTVDGQPAAALRRGDGFLWLVLPAGVHQVRVEGMLAEASEWEWAFQLKPRRVEIEAPGWSVSGVRPDGVPEAQVFFARQRRAGDGEAAYDRPDVQIAALVERHLEIGLVWQVRTTVRRLSPTGKALDLRLPLLPGENVISSNQVVKEGGIEVRLGAQDREFSWQSELAPVTELTLATRPGDGWVERWQLVVSPVWNVTLAGTPPVFENNGADLVPVWQVWPGERAMLAFSQPEAVPGATVMVGAARHETQLGRRQRTSSLTLDLRGSVGGDFPITLPDGAQPVALTIDGQPVPVRVVDRRIMTPLRPGEHKLELRWKQDDLLETRTQVGEVRLPVESANVTSVLQVPQDRWVLWAHGPLRGPAVRFWSVLAWALLAAWVLGRIPHSPLRTVEWMLLAIGLTQVPLPLALVVAGWLFFLRWRGGESFAGLPLWLRNALQVVLILTTLVTLGIFVGVVAAGLLGSPRMFISGNGSSSHWLEWYAPRCGGALPRPGCLSVSIWWYRLLMLAWALWLAASLVRWLGWAWRQFSTGGCFPRDPRPPVQPPPLPGAR